MLNLIKYRLLLIKPRTEIKAKPTPMANSSGIMMLFHCFTKYLQCKNKSCWLSDNSWSGGVETETWFATDLSQMDWGEMLTRGHSRQRQLKTAVQCSSVSWVSLGFSNAPFSMMTGYQIIRISNFFSSNSSALKALAAKYENGYWAKYLYFPILFKGKNNMLRRRELQEKFQIMII